AAAGGDVQSASGVSGLERGETQGRDSRDDPANRLDGRRILAIPAVRAAEHRAERGAGWFGKFRCGAAARERRAVSDWAHERVGAFFFCARAVWEPAAF